MKNYYLTAFRMPFMKAASLITTFFFLNGSLLNAQSLATYPLRTPNFALNNNTPNGEAQTSLTNANVEALKMVYGTNMEQANHNSTGVRMRTNVSGNTAPWPTMPTNGYGFDIPLSPRAGYDMNITGITVSSDPTQFDVDVTGTVFYIVPYFQVDGAGPWFPLAAPQTISATTTNINFGTINETFYDTHKYTIRFYVYSSTGASDSKSDYFRLINLVFNGTVYQPPAQAVTVTTVSASATGKYTATAAGTYSFNGTQFYLVKQSGVIWSSSPSAIITLDTSAITKTTNGSAGVINSNITGLSAATTYYVKAYIVTQFGLQYGSPIEIKTDPATVPTVTLSLTNVLSNKLTANGIVTDSGGVFITERGFVYNKTGNPDYTNNNGKVLSGTGSAPFSELIKNLDPNTRYCFKSYAKNNIGIAYSAEQCITTGPPVPVLTAIPGIIDFGPNFFGASPIVVSYILTGKNLTPAAGTITITCPAPFLVSTQAGTGFASSVTVNYTAGKLTSTPIYVQLPTTGYGSWGYTSVLNITHSGGGVAAVDADVVKISGSIEQAPEDVSNRGTEFWTGFAYQEKMKQPAGDAGEAFMALYIATGDQAATVTVSMPGLGGGFAPQTFTIPANSFREVRGFPTGDPNDEFNPNNLPDARLYFTGVTNRGIHIVSTGAPVSVWMHTWTTGNSAAACMLFPTNTWNSSYTVQAYGGTSNNSNPNSFFFVIANEDGTKLTFTPANDILAYITGSGGTVFTENHNASQVLYKKGVEYKDAITLNRGQIFNAMGFISGATGLDLTGTKISTTCEKKIAVFGGNGRVLVKPLSAAACGSSGSDHLVQQMFPTVAWGTKYLTVPTKTMEYNYYRVVVQDPAVPISIKPASVTPGALVDNLYYQFDANVPLEITSTSPINVTQFIIQGTCKNNTQGNGGQGDPEMIILSPVEQAINKVTVYSAGIKRTGSAQGNYINVLIEKAAIDNKSFVIDGIDFNNTTTRVDTGTSSFSTNPYGSSLCLLKDAFKPHPQNPGYYFAKFKVQALTAHTISSAYKFNAIAYGAGDGESYGYNAGTLIKNLTSIKFTDNPNGSDTSNTVVRTCRENPVTLKIALPYLTSQVDSIIWVPGGDPRITPSTTMKGAMNGNIAKSDGTIVGEDGRTFNIYTSPTKYSFSDVGIYNFTVIAYGKFKSDCPGEDRQKIIVNVGRDNAYFEPKASCGSPTVAFDNFTTAMAGTDIKTWAWDFGDGSPVSTQQNPGNHTYNLANGSYYKVKLTTVNSVGCNSYYETDVDFGGGLKVEFTKDPTTAICQNSDYKFTDNTVASGTSGTPNKWVWDFGDGSAKVTENTTPTVQTHKYTTAGKYGAKLEVTTNQGCIDTYVDSVTVEATPVAAIDPNPAFVCLGNEVTYTDKSTITIGNIASWTWTFDDGTTSVDQNPKKTWATSGNHTTTLKVQSAGGCTSTNTATHTINVNAAPIAGFKYDLNCTNRTIAFTDTSKGMGGTINKWTWDFGDGSATSNAQNPPPHVYPATGTYNVSLMVETSNGCKAVVAANKQITIDVAPVADFTLPGNTCLPGATPAFVNGTTISDGTIASVTYAWDFGDGSAANTDKDPTHLYANTGSYTVKLTATSAKGCANAVSKTYSSIFAPPVAAIANIAEVCAGGTATLSSAGSTAAGSTVTGWAWDFGDAATSTDQNPTHPYTTAGSYTVSLTVTSAAGCTSIATTKTAVVNALPTAGFTSDVNCTTRNVAFTDASTPNSGTVNTWTWNYGDGGTGNSATPTHQYTNEGSFTVTLTVKTDKGCTSSTPASKTIVIAAAPVVDFDLPGNLCLPNATGTFANKTTISDGTIAQVTYAWEFGDGQTSTAASPSNTYAAVGPFTVKLTATSNQGCVSTSSKPYNAVYAQPTAVITAPAGVCLGNNTSFSSSQSTAPASTVTGWAWNFGDGGTSTDQNPVYIYATAGNKTVTLIVTSQAGCSSVAASQSFDVNLSPVPNFTFSAVRCEDSVITFNDASTSNATGGITEYKWNFGDGSAPLVQTVLAPATHTFATTQTFNVSLELKNANGCLSPIPVFSLPVAINPNPVSSFTVSDICIPGGAAQFTQAATISSGSVTAWDWSFGEATIPNSSSPTPQVNYPTGGEYPVTVKATSDQGCAALYTETVKAYNVPTPLFGVTEEDKLCSNLPVTITDSSKVNGYGSVSKIEIYWDFLANPTAKEVINAPAPTTAYSHLYTEFGIPAFQQGRVMIRAFSGNGCTADFTKDIVLLAAPKVQFAEPAAVCQEAQPFNLTGASDIYGLAGSGEYSGNGITTSPEFSPAQAGFGSQTIRYTYTTQNGCTDFEEKQLVVNPTPVIDFGGPEINVLEGDVMKLEPKISYGATYLWSPSTYLNNPASATPSGLPINDITYTLAVTSDKGCFAETSVFVRVVRNYIVPNTFTPNNDNIHDRWEISNLKYYPSVRVRVYNRSGQLVFESLGYNTPWDGKYKGKDMPFGTYYYVIETGGGRKPRTGYVTILK